MEMLQQPDKITMIYQRIISRQVRMNSLIPHM